MAGLIGCDLEYAVKGPQKDYIPAGFLPINGTKGHPEPFPTGGVEIDGCAVELTMEPADTEDKFVNTILSHLRAMSKKYKEYGNLVTVASVSFDPYMLAMAPFANIMGCDPDFNVWTMKMNPRPEPKDGFRTFGGHIHIEDGTEETIKACDLTLGMWSVLNDPDKERRRLYGKAGAFRKKSYGVEYRVLSNFWCGREDLIRKAWQLTQAAKELSLNVDQTVKSCGGHKRVQAIINKSDIDGAANILKTLGVI